MKVKEIIEKCDLNLIGGDSALDNHVSGAYMSDLLSDVMGNAREGQLWITLQNHKNVLAVAALKDMAGIIFINGVKPDDEFISLAETKNIALLFSNLPAFETAGKLYSVLKK